MCSQCHISVWIWRRKIEHHSSNIINRKWRLALDSGNKLYKLLSYLAMRADCILQVNNILNLKKHFCYSYIFGNLKNTFLTSLNIFSASKGHRFLPEIAMKQKLFLKRLTKYLKTIIGTQIKLFWQIKKIVSTLRSSDFLISNNSLTVSSVFKQIKM